MDVRFHEGDSAARIFSGQVRLLFRGACEAYLATIVNAGLLGYIQRDVIAGPVILTWLVYMILITGARTGLVFCYWRAPDKATRSDRWIHFHAAGTLLAGLGWGAAGVFLYSPESLIHQVFLVFVLGGMAAGATTVLTSRLEVFLIFAVPALAPITMRLFLERDGTHMTMGVMFLIYTAALVFTAYRMHRTIKESLEMRIQNADLVEHLLSAKEHADRLNVGLKREIGHREETETALRERTQELLARQADLKRLAAALQRTEQRERHRLATDLHDNLAQLLALCKLKLAALQGRQSVTFPSTRIEQIQAYVDEALAYTRQLMADLRPVAIGRGSDVMAAVQSVLDKATRQGLHITVRGGRAVAHLDEEVLSVTCRCLHELLFNVLKHARTNQALVTVAVRASTLRVVVRDAGVGFAVPRRPMPSHDGGFGLFSMAEQMESIGGQLKIVSVRGKGTWARLLIPLEVASVPLSIDGS